MIQQRRAVTIVELLVVLAIISVLLGLLLPAVQASRERAREAVCKNNLHQLQLAMVQYENAHRRPPERAEAGAVGGWAFEILPFLEANNLHDDYFVGIPLEEAPKKLWRAPMVMRCPSRSVLRQGDDEIQYGQFVLVRCRDWWQVADAPVDLDRAWLNGPELAPTQIKSARGPHHGTFHVASRGGDVTLMQK